MPVFSAEYLEDLSVKIFKGAGVPDDEAGIVARFLVKSNLCGHDSHGVIRVPQYVAGIQKGTFKPGVEVEIVGETPATAVLNGNWGFGQVVASKAMRVAIEKAKSGSLAVVTAHHCNHVGRLADYALMAAEGGMIAMATVNNHGGGLLVAPYGGRERRLSTNPICYALPTGRVSASYPKGEPIVLDIATGVVAEGKVRVMRNSGESLPEGWILDANGNPSTNPEDLYAQPPGAILPFGGAVAYKGFGLSLIMDILAGTLSGAGCSRKDAPRIGNGVFFSVINISSFLPVEEFKSQVDQLIEFVKSSKLASGFDEILVPGEPESRTEEKRRKEGIFVGDETWNQIKNTAESVGVRMD